MESDTYRLNTFGFEAFSVADPTRGTPYPIQSVNQYSLLTV